MSGDQEKVMEQLREENAKEREAREKAEELAKNLEEKLRVTSDELAEEKKKSLAKDAELRKVSIDSSLLSSEGSINFEVEVEKVGEEEIIYSPYTAICGANFRLGCRIELKNWEKWLVAYLYCNDNTTNTTHSTMTAFTLILASPTHPEHESFTIHFLPSLLSHRWRIDLWEVNVMNPRFGHVKNGCCTLKAHIKVIAYYKNAFIDFASPDPDLSDVILLVGGRQFNANRMLLAQFCGYFKALFCSNFAEKNKKEIKLDEINADEFEEMLHFIYHQRKKATTATVMGLLRMSDFFDVHVVRMECIKFILASTDFTPADKLLLSEEFRLSELQYHVVESLNQADDLQKVIDSADFEAFSVPLKNSLLQKHFKLIRK